MLFRSVSTEISALLSFALDDVKDFSSRNTTFSKTIVLPGTARNNKLFGHIYQTGQSGVVFSGRYRDMAPEWAQGRYRALQLNPPQWGHRLTLTPG